MGERLVRLVCRVWEDESTRHPLTVILRNAVEREDAARLLSQFVERELVGSLPLGDERPDAGIRHTLAYSSIVGLVVARYVVRVEPLASASVDDLARAMGPALQQYLTGDAV
jgi:hypothetical protein